MFRIGYNTNGLAHHRPLDALRLLAGLGYEGVALTPDVGPLDPLAPDPSLLADLRHWADELGLDLAVETGARFVLDAERKHWPTLLEDDANQRARRVRFLKQSVDLAAAVGAGVVSLWSGRAVDEAVGDARAGSAAAAVGQPERSWERLCAGVREVLHHGREQGVQIAFEPEPGMFLERPAGYLELLERLGSDGDELGLCLDVGHLLCTGDLPVDEVVRELAPRLVMVQLDDVRDGVHEHRMFGEGDLDLAATLRALIDVGYDGMAAVELSRDSHRGPAAAREAFAHVMAAFTKAAE